MKPIPIIDLSIVFLPTACLLLIMFRWGLKGYVGLFANFRMVFQLLLVGYFLTYIFEIEQPIIIVLVIILMVVVSAWIAIRSIEKKNLINYFNLFVSIGLPGLVILGLVTQLVLELETWFEPKLVVPIAGMIFANSMNTVSLAAERFEVEFKNDKDIFNARRDALHASLIPQVNSLFAVGLVALPGMMTGQILSGVDPIIAVRYQIMVMWMTFGSGGLSSVLYLFLRMRGIRQNIN